MPALAAQQVFQLQVQYGKVHLGSLNLLQAAGSRKKYVIVIQV